MSLNPSPQHSAEAGNPAPDLSGSTAAQNPIHNSRAGRIWTVCFIALTFEIGGFLVFFPWREAWHLNHFPALFPSFLDIWDNPYFRGAVSGLGVVNLLIAVTQAIYFFRSSRNS
jgi:hypothetical protein